MYLILRLIFSVSLLPDVRVVILNLIVSIPFNCSSYSFIYIFLILKRTSSVNLLAMFVVAPRANFASVKLPSPSKCDNSGHVNGIIGSQNEETTGQKRRFI